MMKNFAAGFCLLIALWLVPTADARPQRQLGHAGGGAERRVALVIGNNSYEAAPLRNPINDARAMARTLGSLGFEVIHREDLSQRDMKRAIREFGGKIRGGGVGLFYYAGHGVQVKGVNYLVPVDAVVENEEEVEYECVDAGFVLAQMESAGNSMNIMILDACRNNPFARSFRSASRGLAQMDAPSGTLIAYATAPGSVASDGSAGNGTYTQELLKSVTTPGLSVEEVFKRVRISVRSLTAGRQTPWEASSLTGDFYFNRAAESAASDGPRPAAGGAGAAPETGALDAVAPPRAGAPAPDEGGVNGSTYTNKFFGMSMTFPAGWSVHGKETEAMINDMGKRLVAGDDKNMQAAFDVSARNNFTLLTVSQHALGAPVEFNPLMMVTAERVSQFPGVKRGSDFLFNVRRLVTQSQLQYRFGEVYPEKINGVEFDVMPGTLSYGPTTVKQKMHVAIRNGFALSIVFNYQTDQHLAELERALKSVTFR